MLRAILGLLILGVAAPSNAQDASSRTAYDHVRDAPVAVAARATTPIRVDGVLDEPA